MNRRSLPIAAIVSVALGVGAATAVFSVVDGILLKPFPVADQDRLLVVWTAKPQRGFDHWPFSYAGYEHMRERLRTVSGTEAHPYAGTLDGVLRTDDGSAMAVRHAVVTGGWFDLLGVGARAGRMLAATDDHTGAPRVAVVSSGFAERLFGRVQDAVGRRLRIQEGTYTVVGVAPADFDFPRDADVWLPAAEFRQVPEIAWDLIVRVAPGVSAGQAVSDMTTTLRNLPGEPGPLGETTDQVIRARRFADVVVDSVRPALRVLAGTVALMLMAAAMNVANLLVVHGLARRRELLVRVALGASQGRIFRQLAVDAIRLAAVGAAFGVLVAHLALGALLALAPGELPRLGGIAIDGRALAFAGAAAMLCALVAATLPAFHLARVEPAAALRAPDADVRGPSGYGLRHGLVVAQIALATLVLSTAGLLVTSFDRMQRLDVGFAANDILLAEIAIPPSRYVKAADLQRAMVRLSEQVATMPGVQQSSAIVTAPFAGTGGVDATVYAEGQTFDGSMNPIVNYEGVDATYFSTLGISIVSGRGIEAHDRERTDLVAVINESFANLFWPGRDAIGRRIKWGSADSDDPWITVVGIAADTRYRDLTTVRPAVYIPYPQGIPVSPGYVAIRTNSPGTAAGSVREAVARHEPGATVVRVSPLRRLLAAPLARPRFESALVSCFAAVAIVLSIVGTDATLSFVVRQRRREIGIRMALGAVPSNVRRLVMRHAMTLGAAGVLLGTIGAVAAARLVQPLLFDVAPRDPVLLSLSAAAMLLSTAAATWLPTRLATRTDPTIVLRH